MQKEILFKVSQIIKQVVLSKANVIKWEKTACKTLEKLHDIFPFQTFFCVFCDKEFVVYCFHVDRLKESQKRKLIQKVVVQIQKYYKNFDSNNLNIYFYKLNLNDNFILNHQIDFVLEKPSFGGLIGVGFVYDEQYCQDKCLAEIVLSIMALVIGSTKKLSTTLIKLERLAGSDPLTGIYNKKIFEDIVKKEIAFAKRQEVQETFSLVCFDLDNFKQINDVYGHLFGDLYLNKFVELIQQELRQSDICARLGGDEFAVLLRQCDAHNAKRLLERIKRKVENFALKTDSGENVKLEFSAGISEFPVHGTQYSQLYNTADSALYIAKQSGKGLVCVGNNGNSSDKFMQKQKDLVFLEKIIFEKKIVPYFQPILNVQNGLSVVGYEVLMRFLSLNGTPIPAGKYIDLAEQSGKIINLGKIVLSKALEYKKNKNISSIFFLNLSPKEIKNQYYLKWLLSFIKDLEIKPDEICFEITERESLGSIYNVQRSIYMLLERGFKIAIDDFGSGYSTFAYIRNFPIDFVKIDKEFIHGLDKDNFMDLSFVKMFRGLCDSLGISVIAEGVENQKILDILKENNISFAQGYHLGMPEPEIQKTKFAKCVI